MRNPPPFEQRPLWIAGEVDGFARLSVTEGSQSGWLELAVAPRARRRGLGLALLGAATAKARRLGCKELAGRHATPAGAAFAAAAGARDTRTDVSSLLDLRRAVLAAPAVDGYRLLSWVGAAPQGLLASYALARNAINDAPGSNDLERQPWTEETVRGEESMLERRGRELRVTVALGAADDVTAFTELRVSAEPGSVASTEDTATCAADRGRGLAGWVKAESLRRLRAERPDVSLVTTTNAAGNEPILALNRRIGFERVAVATTASVSLEGARVQ